MLVLPFHHFTTVLSSCHPNDRTSHLKDPKLFFVTLPRWRCLNVPARICTKMAKDSLDWKAFFSNKIFNCSQIIFARTKILSRIFIYRYLNPITWSGSRPPVYLLSYEGPVCVFVHLRKPMPLVLKNINCQNPRKFPPHTDAHNTIQTFAFEAPL